jgi:hypothetical protein
MVRRIAALAALVLGGLLVALLVAEGGVRLAQPIALDDLLPIGYDHDALRRIAAGGAYLRFDPQLGWSPTPDTRREVDGALYQTNGAGLRAEREYALEPGPRVRRFAAFGDSFTHCDEVAYADCWTRQLELAWAGTEVLNFGVPGYGPDQAWLRYQRDGRSFRPCGVLIGYLVENVNRVVNRFRPFYSPGDGIPLAKPRFLLEGDGLSLLPNPAVAPEQLDDDRWVETQLGPHDLWYFPNTFVASPIDVLQVGRVARSAAYQQTRRTMLRGDERFPLYGEPEALEVAARVLVGFARQVREDGATPVVVVFSTRRDVLTFEEGNKAHQPLLDRLARENVPTLEVASRLDREVRRTGPNRVFAPEGHYRAPGNAAVASLLANQLPRLTAATCGSD